MTFAEKVKTARSELGLTQTELAEKAGVSLRTVSAYEHGTKVPRQSTILRLASALNVSVKFLEDDDCLNPSAEIERDGFIAAARKVYGGNNADTPDVLLGRINALFAGAELPQEDKDAFMRAVMDAYYDAKPKGGKKE